MRKADTTRCTNVRLFTSVNTHVRTQVTNLTEFLTTDTALPRFFARMQCPLVSQQLMPVLELPRTDVALVRSLVRMNCSDMSLQGSVQLERFPALGTNVWPQSAAVYRRHVCLEYRRLLEPTTTVVTNVGPGIRVSPLVIVSGRRLSKTLSAAWKTAHGRSFSRVRYGVCCQELANSKLTAAHGAHKWQLLIHGIIIVYCTSIRTTALRMSYQL